MSAAQYRLHMMVRIETARAAGFVILAESLAALLRAELARVTVGGTT